MKKHLLFLLFFWFPVAYGFASHIRGGEITAIRRAGSSNTFDFTLTIYQDPASNIPDPTNILFFGDGTSKEEPKVSEIAIPGSSTTKNIYRFTHTYGAPGQYIVSHARQYRNCSVQNIGPSPCAVWFYVETLITIAPSLDQPPNHSPVLLTFAVDPAGLGQVFLHNPVAFDQDGDSLSFEILESRNFVPSIGGVAIPAYQFPDISAGGQDSLKTGPSKLTIDPKKGTLKWDVPNRLGEFNVAFIVREWRFGSIIGYVVRDMQIIVRDAPNKRPLLTIPADTCILANTFLQDTIKARDPNKGDFIAITANGGLFTLSPTTVRGQLFPPNTLTTDNLPVFQTNPARSLFRWRPGCNQVRRQPYDATFKAEDKVISPNSGASLIDIKTWSIRVIGPPPDSLKATAGLGSIGLNWQGYTCANIGYFNIYRRIDSSTFNPDTCTVGVPAESGYALIGSTDGVVTSFLDDNNGIGLKRDARYCYRITAVFLGATSVESKQSAQVCAELKLDVPILTNVSVTKTGKTDGQIFVRWLRPRQVDTVKYPGPYRYILKRSQAGTGAFSTVKSVTDLNDTTFTDQGLNTDIVQYSYQVVFAFADPLGGVFKDSADAAQNIKLAGTAGAKSISLNWTADVPWSNAPYGHTIYKKVQGIFVPFDTVAPGVTTFTDTGMPDKLVAGQFYTYYVLTRGRYARKNTPDTLANLSYEISLQVKDTVPPCPPQKIAISNQTLTCPTCDDIIKNPGRKNLLTWSAPKRDSCALDLSGYNIYFKATLGARFSLLVFTKDTFLLHSNNGSLAGCYRVFTVDSSGNEGGSLLGDSVICNDNCVSAELPNIITPSNGDDKNEFWRPICITPDFIAAAELKVYNRWGGLVYTSAAKDIRWPSPTEQASDLAPGTYFYYLQLQPIRLQDNPPALKFKGWIEVVKK